MQGRGRVVVRIGAWGTVVREFQKALHKPARREGFLGFVFPRGVWQEWQGE